MRNHRMLYCLLKKCWSCIGSKNPGIFYGSSFYTRLGLHLTVIDRLKWMQSNSMKEQTPKSIFTHHKLYRMLKITFLMLMCHIQKRVQWNVGMEGKETDWTRGSCGKQTVCNIWFTGQWLLQRHGGTESSSLLWRGCGCWRWSLLCRTWITCTGSWFLIFHVRLQRYVFFSCTSNCSCSE